MKRVSDYSKTMIGQYKRDLENALVESIVEMLDGESIEDTGVDLGKSATLREVEVCDGEVSVGVEWLDEYGENIRAQYDLDELSIDELYCLWDYLKYKAE